MSHVSIIGLGAMGSALTKALLREGYHVTVWNRSSQKMQSMMDAGAKPASYPEEAIIASPIIIVCVSDYAASYQILDTTERRSMLQGKILIQLSTGSPQEARECAQWAQHTGIYYLDGAIACTPSQIGTAHAALFTSGSAFAFEYSESLLRCIASNTSYLGEQVSTASSTELAFLAYLFGSYIGFFHAVRILESDHLRIDSFGAMISQLSPIIGQVMQQQSEVIQWDTYNTAQSSVNMCMTTVRLFMQHAREADINDEFPSLAYRLFNQAQHAGYGEEELAAVVKVMR